MSKPSPKTLLARRVWGRMFDFLIHTAPARAEVLARRGLTPNDSRALSGLDAEHGRSMRSLADEWGCDASNATQIIDRLERLGLVERRGVEHDRRVKLVRLTANGARVKSEILEEFHQPPDELLTLTHADLAALDRALKKLPD